MRHSKRIYWHWVIWLVGSLVACNRPDQSDKQPTNTDKVAQAPDTVRLPLQSSTVNVVADSAQPTADSSYQPGTVAVRAPRKIMEKEFTGLVQGFESRTYAFSVPSSLQVAIRIQGKPNQAVFKLYKKTGDLDETILREEVKQWEGELDKGDYVLKVFLPVQQAARKKKAAFGVTVIATR